MATWGPRRMCALTAGGSAAAAFEAAWLAVASDYPYLSYKRIDWPGLHAAYRRRAEGTCAAQTTSLLSDLLAALADGHVFLRTARGTPIVPYVPPRMARARGAFRPWLAHRYLERGPSPTARGRLSFGVLPGRIGYLSIPRLEPADVVAECDEALAVLRDARSLIVDNRSSAGGNRAEVYRIVARFLRRPLETPPWYTRGERRQWALVAPDGPFPYRRPVVVLVNGLTFSAAELFADLMMRIPDVTVLGETTAGGSSGWDEDAPGHHALPGDLHLRIPTVDGRRTDGTPWETVGVRPHIRVRQSGADLAAGRDRQLECALALLTAP